MKHYILLNEPCSISNPLNPTSQPHNQSAETCIKYPNFTILPLTEQVQTIKCLKDIHTLRRTAAPQLKRHPTHLQKHFPPRPHYYLPHTVGAQAGYCLSPPLPCPKESTNFNLTTTMRKTISKPCNVLPKKQSPPRQSNSQPQSNSASSSASPSSSNTTASSSSSSSSCTPSTSLSLSTRPTESQKTQPLSLTTLEEHAPQIQPSSPNHEPLITSDELSLTPYDIINKKVLPTPPCLSDRVRQVFMTKLQNQENELDTCCRRLPRRKKKPVVAPVA